MQFGRPTGTANNSSRMVQLWSNDDPSSNFAGQAIAIDLDGFAYFAIDVAFSSSYPNSQGLRFYVTDEETKNLTIQAQNQNRTGGRDVTYSATNKTLTFAGAYYNGASSNAYAIPLAIYGVRL